MFVDPIVSQIAAELKVRPAQVQAAVELLDGGATVPSHSSLAVTNAIPRLSPGI